MGDDVFFCFVIELVYGRIDFKFGNFKFIFVNI